MRGKGRRERGRGREGKGEEDYRGGNRGKRDKGKMEDLAKEGLIVTEKSVWIFNLLSQIFTYAVSHVIVIFLDH